MEAAAPDTYNIHMVPNANGPPTPERPLPTPTFSRCTLESRWLSDQNGGNPAKYEIVVEEGREKIWLFERLITKTTDGEIWRSVEVTIEGERYVEQLDEQGKTRRFDVKRMRRDNIEEGKGKMAKDPINGIAALEIVSSPGHPNVRRLEAALDDGENLYVFTPFVDGAAMLERVNFKEGSHVQERVKRVRPLFRQLIKGIAYLHSKGICHADICPESVLIDIRRGRLYIIEFDMSFLMPIDEDHRRHMSVADGRKGMTSYCSPETARGEPYDGVKVDVFAAGAVLFMMLTDFPPFAMPSRIDPRFKRLVYRGDVQGVISLLGAQPVGGQAEDLLRQMMARDPQERPLPHQVLQHPWFTP